MSFLVRTALPLTFGLGIFLAGLFTLRFGLQSVASKRLESWLQHVVHSPLRGVVVGIVATLATQSSAAVTIISMGLVSAGVLEFKDTIAIILGTNVGSTFTVGLLTLKIERIGPYIFAAGLVFLIIALLFRKTLPRQGQLRAFAISLAGFGTLFIGFHLMSHAVAPVTSSPVITNWLMQAKNQPWLGLLAGTIVTALIGSSSASTALTLGLAQSGALPLSAAIAVVFGNNVGTCMTAILASLGGSRPVQRVAATHVLLNAFGALLFMIFLDPFTDLVRDIASDPGQQVFLAHFLFNAISSWIAFPFVKHIAQGLEFLLPDTH